MALTTVFLDAGGVLVTPNWDRVSGALAAHGVTAAPGALRDADPLVRRDIDLGMRGAASDQQRGWRYFDLILEYCGVARSADTDAALADLQAYHAEQNLWERVPDGVPETLDCLRAAGLRLAVVSNANGKVQHLFDRLHLTPYFDVVLDSQVVGVEKPDRRIFEIALERTGASAARTVHVGDLYHVDVEGARGAGLAAILLDVADLYAGFDCPRIRTIRELPDMLRRV